MSIGEATTGRIREQLRSKHPARGLSGQAHLAVLSAALTLGIAFCIAQLEALSLGQTLTVPLTFLYANLVEYWGHRVPMHRPVAAITLLFRGHTLQHHLFFTHAAMTCDSRADFRFLLLPAYMILSLTAAFIIPVGVGLALLLDPNVAWLFAATSFAYYLAYELMHAGYHLPESSRWLRLAWLRALRRRHQRHHDHRFMTQCNFNITFPIGDLLFGTYHAAAAPPPAAAAPLGTPGDDRAS